MEKKPEGEKKVLLVKSRHVHEARFFSTVRRQTFSYIHIEIHDRLARAHASIALQFGFLNIFPQSTTTRPGILDAAVCGGVLWYVCANIFRRKKATTTHTHTHTLPAAAERRVSGLKFCPARRLYNPCALPKGTTDALRGLERVKLLLLSSSLMRERESKNINSLGQTHTPQSEKFDIVENPARGHKSGGLQSRTHKTLRIPGECGKTRK